MEIGNLWILVVLIAVIILPFLWVSRNKKKKKKQILEALKAMASGHQSQIDEHEIFTESAIGLDAANNKLFFYRKKEEEEDKQIIDLDLFNRCAFQKRMRNGVVAHILVELHPREKKRDEIYLDFFNVDIDGQLSGQLEVARKWTEKITRQLES